MKKYRYGIPIVIVHVGKRGFVHIDTFQFPEVIIIGLQQLYQESRRTRLEPIVRELFFLERIQQTEGIVHAHTVLTEMITVILPFQRMADLLRHHAIGHCEGLNAFPEIGMQFIFRNAANGRIFPIHGDILQVVQIAENADMTETAHSCKEREADVRVLRLQHTKESLEGIAISIVQFLAVDGTQQGLVVFIYQNHHLLARLFTGTPDNVKETLFRCRRVIGFQAIVFFPTRQMFVQLGTERILILIITGIQVQVQHGISFPLRLQPFQRQAFKQLFLTQEIGLQRGYQQ